jgi:hypothetical protein
MIGKCILEILFGKGADVFLFLSGFEALFFASSDNPMWTNLHRDLQLPPRSGLIIFPTHNAVSEGAEHIFRTLIDLLPSDSCVDEFPNHYHLTIPLPTGYEAEVFIGGVSLDPVCHSPLGAYTLDYIRAGCGSFRYIRCVGSPEYVRLVVVEESEAPMVAESLIPCSEKKAVTVVSRAFEQYTKPRGAKILLSWTNERLSEPWVLTCTSCQWVVFS